MIMAAKEIKAGRGYSLTLDWKAAGWQTGKNEDRIEDNLLQSAISVMNH